MLYIVIMMVNIETEGRNYFPGICWSKAAFLFLDRAISPAPDKCQSGSEKMCIRVMQNPYCLFVEGLNIR
jgi:hypothetical protein